MLKRTRGDALDDDTYDLGGEYQAETPKRPGLPVEPRRAIRILLDSRRLLGITFLVASVASIVASFVLPKTYEADTVLLYEGAPVLDEEGTPPTQSAFVQSTTVPSRLIEVRERLGWDVPIEELQEDLVAEEITATSMRITASRATAEEAYALVKTTLDVFTEHQLAFNAKELDRLIEHNQRSLELAREQRDAFQRAFDAFREETGSRDLVLERSQLLDRAADLRTRRDEAQVEVSTRQALIAQLEEAQSELPRQVVASAKKGGPVEGPLMTARAELAQANATLSDEHPRVLALKERVAQLEAQRGKGRRSELSEQTLTINPARASVDQELASARAALAAAQERTSALTVLLEEVEREAEALSPSEGAARRARSDLIAATQRVERLTARRAELRDATLAPIDRFRILSPPILPEEATHSKGQVLALVSLPFLVTLIAAFVVLLLALRTLRAYAPREVAWWGNGPVLGTTVWPRDSQALQGFVDELEDQGVHGAGRTLVVPATEGERDNACDFAMKLAEAPWLAAAILDVGVRADPTIVTPPPRPPAADEAVVTPSPYTRPRRLSAHASPSTPSSRAPQPGTVTRSPNRPPRKRTVIGLPAVGPSSAPSDAPTPIVPPTAAETAPSSAPPPDSAGPEPFRRKRGARATVRMIIPAAPNAAPETTPKPVPEGEQAFLLTRPVPERGDSAPPEPRVGPAVLVSEEAPPAAASSNAVMRAAVRLLGNGDDDPTEIRASTPPRREAIVGVEGVALAWNGPLSGPVLRRAARLAHRVIVVVSSGINVVDLSRVRTRLGREEGVGYVLINVDDAYAEVEDRVGDVEEFWQGVREADS
jgi:uncharacterized protein involved in exopolysaccharide biosynthesis